MLTLKGVCHRICCLYFVHDSNTFGPMINRLYTVYAIKKLKNFHSAVCMTPRSQNFRPGKSTYYTSINQIFSFMTDVLFTPERISPLSPFVSKPETSKDLYLTPWSAIWLCSAMQCIPRRSTQGAMHAAEMDLAVLCTPRRLTLWLDAHCRVP